LIESAAGTKLHDMRWLVSLLLVLLACWQVGCADERSDGTAPPAEDALPELKLTDDTPDLLLTWIGPKGGTETGVSIAQVPADSRGMVRVTTGDHGHGSMFYVADLANKQSDGSYRVRVIKRGEWEAEISRRRDAHRAQNAPAPRPPAVDDGDEAQPHGALVATIYGASWCKPCHQAAAYLKKRGFDVTEHDIEKQPRYASEMQRKLKGAGMGGGSIPVIDVAGTILQGFSPRALDNAIAKARKGGTHL
jgi:glutaredoxin